MNYRCRGSHYDEWREVEASCPREAAELYAENRCQSASIYEDMEVAVKAGEGSEEIQFEVRMVMVPEFIADRKLA